jgi:hypothetical protein
MISASVHEKSTSFAAAGTPLPLGGREFFDGERMTGIKTGARMKSANHRNLPKEGEMTSEPDASKPRHAPLRRSVRPLWRLVAALAASFGISMKPGPADAAPETARGAEQRDPNAAVEPGTSPVIRAMLRGSSRAPANLAKAKPNTETAAAAFGDLGFISHIDSGFNDFNDHA